MPSERTETEEMEPSQSLQQKKKKKMLALISEIKIHDMVPPAINRHYFCSWRSRCCSSKVAKGRETSEARLGVDSL